MRLNFSSSYGVTLRKVSTVKLFLFLKMGVCSSCFGSDSSDSDPTPDPEIRRQQQLEAVEKRMREQENRGIKDPEKVRRMQEKAKEKDRLQEEAAKRYDGSGSNLRWQMS